MVVYLVLNTGVCDYEAYSSIELFSTREKAKKHFDKVVKENRKLCKDNGYDEFEESEDTFESYKSGYYSCDHDLIEIKELEVQ